MRPRLLSLLLLLLFAIALLPASSVGAQSDGGPGVQHFLDGQPGALRHYREDERSAASLIESAALYYGLSPQLHLALLEATSGLISDPAPSDEKLRYPFGPAGPAGFAAQIDWASRELRAGLGPYSRPPVLHFSDGLTITLTLDQVPEGVAVQRFLAQGRTAAEWNDAVARFTSAFQQYFHNELRSYDDQTDTAQPTPTATAAPEHKAGLTLLQPWPEGTRVVHLAYFDHVYPTVDSGDDGNGYVVNYLGQANVQYDEHDGHDYYFPEEPVGTPILAAAGGIAYARTHRGNGVVIRHPNGYETVYWHLNSFAPIFAGLIDASQGVPVSVGTVLGTSGSSGFVRGTPHLHFEVRRYGRQVDPYGWQGPGSDPCAAYAGCLPSGWLWAASLAGSFDFTPPAGEFAADGASAAAAGSAANPPVVRTPKPADTTPPVGTFTINPPDDLLFMAGFDGHVVQEVGKGFPTLYGAPQFTAGRVGQALVLGPAGVTYPVAGNLDLAAGTISLWADLPASYPTGRLPRHYLFAASANADDGPVYSGTLALRRDMAGPDGSPVWTFWTTADTADSRDLLSAPDTLSPGPHHFALTWDAATGEKALYLDGKLVASKTGVRLPIAVGEAFQLGRFTYGGGHSGAALDQLSIYRRALRPTEIAALALTSESASGTLILHEPNLRVDTNAIDDQGGIVAVQLGLDGNFEDPQPYYDSYRWSLAGLSGNHELSVRYVDRAGNTATVTRSIELDQMTRIYLPTVMR